MVHGVLVGWWSLVSGHRLTDFGHLISGWGGPRTWPRTGDDEDKAIQSVSVLQSLAEPCRDAAACRGISGDGSRRDDGGVNLSFVSDLQFFSATRSFGVFPPVSLVSSCSAVFVLSVQFTGEGMYIGY